MPSFEGRQVMLGQVDLERLANRQRSPDAVGPAVGLFPIPSRHRIDLLCGRMDPGVARENIEQLAIMIADTDDGADAHGGCLQQVHDLDARLFKIGIEG
jgi:hypothetical protein